VTPPLIRLVQSPGAWLGKSEVSYFCWAAKRIDW